MNKQMNVVRSVQEENPLTRESANVLSRDGGERRTVIHLKVERHAQR